MKRKKFLVLGSFMLALVAFAGSYHAYTFYSNAEESDLLMANVEALAGGEEAKNTGPGDPFKCPNGGKGKWCLCTNSHPCTETPC